MAVLSSNCVCTPSGCFKGNYMWQIWIQCSRSWMRWSCWRMLCTERLFLFILAQPWHPAVHPLSSPLTTPKSTIISFKVAAGSNVCVVRLCSCQGSPPLMSSLSILIHESGTCLLSSCDVAVLIQSLVYTTRHTSPGHGFTAADRCNVTPVRACATMHDTSGCCVRLHTGQG